MASKYIILKFLISENGQLKGKQKSIPRNVCLKSIEMQNEKTPDRHFIYDLNTNFF